MRVFLPVLLAACAGTQAGNNIVVAHSLFIGNCDLFDLRQQAADIIEDRNPRFAIERDRYRMELYRQSRLAEIELVHVRREGSQRGGGYAVVFDAETCEFARLTPQR